MLANLNTPYLVIILILFCIPSSYQQSCNIQDQSSLLAFSSLISTTSSFPPLNWSSSISCCSWEGVDCDVNGRVIGLRLPSRGLEGAISSSIKNLVSLTQLDLSNNLFSGSLPTGLFESLDSLETLDLSFNQLDGDFSSSKGGLPTTIHKLDISNNYFHGLIESSLFVGASDLSSFNSSKNSFSGFIPCSICINSPLLKLLDLSYNNVSGLIPRDIGECSKLEIFRARNNSLSGSIPSEIGNLGMLKELNLVSNDLSGSIPPSLMNCTNLVSLLLRMNILEGEISTLNFSKLARLQKLDLSHNMLNGTFPESLCDCKAIVAVRVATNNLTGQISPKISELNSLSFLSLTNNSFTNIASTLRILAGSKNLTTLFLGYNFYGETLPSDRSFLGSNGFRNMQFLSLLSCNLSGYFPEWISKMKNLRILHMGKNRMSGTIPKWIGTLPNLFALELSNNLLTGEIPIELFLLPALVSANVSNLNHLYFDLPVFSIFPGRHTWDQFVVYPPQICLQNNSISGKIPSEIGKLKNLHMLLLNGNNLSGGIPVQISYLKNLEQLSLAHNHLTGEIPASLQSLSFLSKFNVSYNDLEGPIPTGGQFDTFQGSSYEGNPGLCGEALQHPCEVDQNDPPRNDDGNDDEGFGWNTFLDGVVVGFSLGFSGVLAFVGSSVWYKSLYFQRA